MAGSEATNAVDYIDGMTRVLERIDPAGIDRYVDLLHGAWLAGRGVFLFGNGGSALTASHHACDYVKTASVDGQPRLRAMCLSDNVGLSTAIGNDLAYEDLFVYPLTAYAQPGDLAVAISCSGRSPNVVRAIQWARRHAVVTVALTGFAGGELGALADLHLNVPSDNYGVIEDLHLSIGHVAAQGLRGRILAQHSNGRSTVDAVADRGVRA